MPIVICSPLDMVIETQGLSPQRIEDLTGRRPRIWELRTRIKKIARAEHLYFLDLTRPFKGKAYLMTTSDGVHPNQEGYHYLAGLVFRFLSKKSWLGNRHGKDCKAYIPELVNRHVNPINTFNIDGPCREINEKVLLMRSHMAKSLFAKLGKFLYLEDQIIALCTKLNSKT